MSLTRRTVSAETISGTEVKNYGGEHLGTIEDVMIDCTNGKIAYLVLSYGGIFGTTFADKRFAIPFSAIAIENADINDNSDIIYRLDIAKDMLKYAPGFDKDRYPDFADEKFTSNMNSFFATMNPRLVA